MARLALLLVPLLLLGACALPAPDAPVIGPGEGTLPYAYRPGQGIVEAVARIHADAAAAAGGTVGRYAGRVAWRLTVRMDDGTVQTVLQDEPGFAVGDRVRLTRDGRVVRL